MGEKGAAGAAGSSGLRLVDEPLNNTVTCGDGEVLVSIICKSGAPNGATCQEPGARGVCMRTAN